MKHMNNLKKTLRDKASVRWFVLFTVAFIQATNYYFYDAISPLKRLLESQYGFTSTDFGLFVSVYSIPNVFLAMAILGGIILDAFGIRRTGFLFVGMMAGGAVITAYGSSSYFHEGGIGYAFMGSFLPSYSPELKMMLLGRFFYGLGAETSIVVISKIIVKWFKGKELALAFGLKIGIARAGSMGAFIVSSNIAENVPNWPVAVWLAAILVGIGLLAFFVYVMFDVRLDRQRFKNLEMPAKERFSWSDLGKLVTNRSFIYVTLLCVTFYSAVFPFQSYAPDFFLNKFGYGFEKSGYIASLLSFGTMIFTPIFGLLVDTRGRSATLMIFGSILIVLVHLAFSLTMISPILLMILLGIAFSLVPAAMWPSIAKFVDEKRIGTAYGAMFTVQNLGLWAFPLLIGIVLDRTNPQVTPEALAAGEVAYNYKWAILMLAVLGLLGVVFAVLLKREDKVSGYGLEKPNKVIK
jgi:MFS family permease